MILKPIYGQNLDGKWILKEVGYKEFKKNIGLQILRFENDKAELFTDLKLTKSELDLDLKDSVLVQDNGKKYGDFKLLDDNFLRVFTYGTFNDDKVEIEMDFVRLLPTKTDLSQEKIERLYFEVEEDGKSKNKIAFNQELWDRKTLEELEWKEGSKMIIEKLDATYFITIFNHGKKGATLPISEVNLKLLKFYCVPNETGVVIATRLE